MRNLLLLLLLANILYAVWNRYNPAQPETGIAIISRDQLGPELKLADPVPAENGGLQGADTRSRGPAPLQAQAGRSCVSIGPFTENAAAAGALADLEDAGLQGALRTTPGEVFVGHWVQIRGIENRAAANAMLARLKEDGLDEAYIVQTEDEGIKISLGLFNELDRAERVELQAKSLELPAEISPRMREQDLVFVDLGLPPGRGAGAMIEQFGEERVLLRERATCPGAG